VGRLSVIFAVPLGQPPGDALAQRRIFPLHPTQEPPDGFAEEAQPGEESDVADDVGGVQTLLARAQAQGLDDAVGGLLEGTPAAVVGHEPDPEVVQGLPGQVRFLPGQPQGVVPQEIELQLLQGLFVGEVKHLLQDMNSQHRLHRPIGPPVVRVVHRGEAILVDQGKGPVSENLGLASLHQPGLPGRHQELRLEQAPLGVALSKHALLPGLGLSPTPSHTLCPTWPSYARGFLRGNQPCSDE